MLDKNRIPIIVYDYIGTKDPRTNDYYVIGGHKVSDPKKIIFTNLKITKLICI